jgi:hypothetical protein
MSRTAPAKPSAWLPLFLACMIFGAAAAAGASDWRSFAVFAAGVLFFGWPYAARLNPARPRRASSHR